MQQESAVLKLLAMSTASSLSLSGSISGKLQRSVGTTRRFLKARAALSSSYAARANLLPTVRPLTRQRNIALVRESYRRVSIKLCGIFLLELNSMYCLHAISPILRVSQLAFSSKR
jgi:hypothetical protein